MPVVDRLYELQKLDEEADRIQKRLTWLEQALARADEVEVAQARWEAARQTLRRREKALEEAEYRVRELREKRRNIERMFEEGRVRNPRQAVTLQEEIAYLTRKIDEAEDRALEALTALEEAQTALQEAEAALREARANRARQEEAWRAEQSRLQERLALLQERRAALVQTFPQDVLATYEDLRTRKQGLAVATVDEGACAACGAMLSAARLQAAKNLFTLTFCPQCGRILYGG